jgi:aminoglycoside phosphotransferase (APT) family kinase protein
MALDWLDQSRAVRPGEELDTSRLEDYLRSHLSDFRGPLTVEQFPSGYSNLTYLLRAGKRELVLRRPPFGARVKSGHDMHREYRILSHLVDVYSKVPRPLSYCEDESVIGAPFYVMERVSGVILRAKPPKGLHLSSDTMRRLSEALTDNLAELHRLDYKAAGLGDLGHPEGYIQRQVEGWTQRYKNAQTDNVAEMEQVARWMADHMPPQAGAALIHNDYKYDNLLLDPKDLNRIIAVLDWEMATIGDPLMDLGTTLGYWVDADDPPEAKALAFGVTTLPGNLTRQQLLERYAEKSGCDVSHALFYYVYALFKIAVIVQQIYYRYQQGHTQDQRFATLIMVVNVLAQQATCALDKGRIDHLTS